MAHLSANNIRVVRQEGDPPDTLILCGLLVSEHGEATVSPIVLTATTREQRLLEVDKRIGEWARALKDFVRSHPERLGL